jgi:hypothetical protein
MKCNGQKILKEHPGSHIYTVIVVLSAAVEPDRFSFETTSKHLAIEFVDSMKSVRLVESLYITDRWDRQIDLVDRSSVWTTTIEDVEKWHK